MLQDPHGPLVCLCWIASLNLDRHSHQQFLCRRGHLEKRSSSSNWILESNEDTRNVK